MIPSLLTRKHRRVSIEVHRIAIAAADPDKKSSASQKKKSSASHEDSQEGTDYYEECILRCVALFCSYVSFPSSSYTLSRLRALRLLVPDRKNKLPKKMLELTGKKSDEVSAYESDEESVAASVFAAADGIEDEPDYAGWKAKYRLPLESVTVKRVHRKTVDVIIQDREIKHYRDFIFETEQDAKDFAANIDSQKQAGERRAAAKLKAALGEVKVDKKAMLTLLIEIVSGWDLPAADFTSSDPYVVCFMSGREVHRTKHIPKT